MTTPVWTIAPSVHPQVVDLSDNNAGFATAAEFAALRAAGVEEVIHKSSQGAREVDPRYAARRPLAVAAGLRWSAYHFCTSDPVPAQLAHFLASIGDRAGLHRIALDAEANRGATIAPTDAAAFALLLDQEWGSPCLRYGNASVPEYRQPGWHTGPLWWARYGPEPTIEMMQGFGINPANVVLWQATATGHIASHGPLDLSYARPT
jgi:GH25 family lysozyme M1 (1,4-beta-N-acetylmuramidase)